MREEDGRGGREAEAEEEEGGYRTKNKNPTRQCGELWKITMLFMGKSSISTGPFSIANC